MLRAAHDDRETRANAAEWLRLGAPETAAAIYEGLGDSRSRGSFYGEALLGITSRDFQTGDPLDCNEEQRGSSFAKRALESIEQSQDPALVSAAVLAFGSQAGVLYADGKIDWDYTPVLKDLLRKAGELDPAGLSSYAISTELPTHGQRPPGVLAIGGAVMQKNLIPQSQVPPVYPAIARRGGIQGTALFNLLIGLDGAIVKMAAVSGPPELVRAAAEAVRHWRYQPVLSNGRPCYVLTVVEVHFTLH